MIWSRHVRPMSLMAGAVAGMLLPTALAIMLVIGAAAVSFAVWWDDNPEF